MMTDTTIDQPEPDTEAIENKALERELTALLNRYSCENKSDTPDFILADYLLDCLAAWNAASRRRDNWYGRGLARGGGYVVRTAYSLADAMLAKRA